MKMLVIDDIRNVPRQQVLFVLIGDGRTEIQILPSIMKRYDRNDVFAYFNPTSRATPGAGLSVLSYIPNSPINGPSNFLLVVDGDQSSDDQTERMMGYCRSKIIKTINEEEDHAIYQCQERNREFKLNVCLCGNIFIEEELSAFMKAEKGLDVPPNKDLMTELKKYGYRKKQIQKAIEEAKLSSIANSFCGLHKVLYHIEQNGLG